MRAILPILFAVIVAGSSLVRAANKLPTLKAERWNLERTQVGNDAR